MRGRFLFWHATFLLLQVVILIRNAALANADVARNNNAAKTAVPPPPIRRKDKDVLRIIETEVWDEDSQSWKAMSGEKRWSDERGRASPSPSEVQPPKNFDFDGDWKIVVSGSDSMGWEYSFQYLRPPTRRRTWLRGLKGVPSVAVTSTTTKSSARPVSRAIARLLDGYNFKGFSCRLYKSLISWESFGVGIGLPLSMNFDFFDRNPGLPSISSTVGLYFPLTFTAAISASVHVEWIRWFLKTVIFFIPRILLVFTYRFILPTFWAVTSAALLPLGSRLPPMPNAPTMTISRPRYNSDISERLGCSLSYRWSKRRGFEWRLNYWHSYLPTFVVIRKILSIDRALDWWDKHFGSFGLSSGYPLPLPPHYSCSACLGVSGLYLRNRATTRATPVVVAIEDNGTKVSVASALKESGSYSSDSKSQQEKRQQNAAKSAIVTAGGLTAAS